MSYDVCLIRKKAYVMVGDTTYNLGPMYAKALGIPLRALDGMPGRVASVLINEAIRELESKPAKFDALNPPNGWGSYESALGFLRALYVACVEHPKHRVVVT